MLINMLGICYRDRKALSPFDFPVLIERLVEQHKHAGSCYALNGYHCYSVVECGHICATIISQCCECSNLPIRSCYLCACRKKMREWRSPDLLWPDCSSVVNALSAATERRYVMNIRHQGECALNQKATHPKDWKRSIEKSIDNGWLTLCNYYDLGKGRVLECGHICSMFSLQCCGCRRSLGECMYCELRERESPV